MDNVTPLSAVAAIKRRRNTIQDVRPEIKRAKIVVNQTEGNQSVETPQQLAPPSSKTKTPLASITTKRRTRRLTIATAISTTSNATSTTSAATTTSSSQVITSTATTTSTAAISSTTKITSAEATSSTSAITFIAATPTMTENDSLASPIEMMVVKPNCVDFDTPEIMPSQLLDRKQIFRSYIGLVIDDMVPLNALNSPNMQKLLQPLCERLINVVVGPFDRENCCDSIRLMAKEIRRQSQNELSHHLLSIKIIDGAFLEKGVTRDSIRMPHKIFMITAQYIADDCIKTKVLGLSEIKDAHWSKLTVDIVNILNGYNIDESHIVSMTAFNDGTDLNPCQQCGEIYCISCNKGTDENPPELNLAQIPVQLSMTHMVRFVASDVTRHPEIFKYLNTCRNLIRYITKPSNMYDKMLLAKECPLPQLDCPTSWTTTYKMIEDLRAGKEIIDKIKIVRSKNGDIYLTINDELWDFIESFCIVFRPLQKTIVRIQMELLHCGNFYAQWLKLKICIKQIIENCDRTNDSMMSKFGHIILNSIDYRDSQLSGNDDFNACLYLDPRFQHTLISLQRERAVNHLKKLWTRITAFGLQDVSCNTNGDTGADFIDEDDKMLNEFLTRKMFSHDSDKSLDIVTKLNRLELPLLRSDTNVLKFWQARKSTDPELYLLSNICFAIPTTHLSNDCATEGLRSLLVANGGANTTCESLEDMLLVKTNPHLLDTAIDALLLFGEEESDRK